MASRMASKGRALDVLSAAYLEGTGNKSELLRRLAGITEALSALPDEVDPTSHPGLLSLSAALVSPSILSHRDKDVRLCAVLAACELFYIFAPEPPWEESEILAIFAQVVRQLGNLHATVSEGANFESYFRILEQLSEVKIGVVLVDLIRTERGGSSGDTDGDGIVVGGEGESPLETLCLLLRTLLNCVHVDHPPEVAAHVELAVSACVEEFEGSVPVQVLEELLTCVGAGPVVWVTNPAFAALKAKKRSPKLPGSGGNKGKGGSVGSRGGREEDDALPPPQIQQTNPSYLVAAKVLRRTEDKISSPIAALLNGLLTGDSNVMGQTSLSTVDAEAATLLSPKGGSGKKKRKGARMDDDAESPTLAVHLAAMSSKDANSGANVYAISYELHRIAPQILTTVIGTVSAELVNQDLTKRWQATRLLGRLFGARSSDIASRFGPCFREWLRRSYDPEPKVRETMVKCLVNFLTTQYSEADLCFDVNEALAAIIVRDPVPDIRLLGIHQACDLAHSASVAGSENDAEEERGSGGPGPSRRRHPISVISPELLQAVGNRVSSKNKTEHRDAITGLAQVYHKHYLRKKLKYVQEGGEDVPLDVILDVWRETMKSGNDDSVGEEKFAWIPQKVFECVSYPDIADVEMRNRVFQIVDDVLLGTSKKDQSSGSTFTPTSRAVGLALIVASVKRKNDAYKWMCTLLTQRGRLQKALGAYLDARSKAKECESGSAEAFAAGSEAKEKLELVAFLSAPVGKGSPGKSPGGGPDPEAIVKKVHAAKDKHIFRILSTICDPTHSPSARIRALDELPKRTKGLGVAAQSWVKTLARRCAMGAFLNADSVEHCIMLSQESFEYGDCEASARFLECVKLATAVFPSLGSTEAGFKNLMEFFDAARSTTNLIPSMKKDMEKYGVVTTLSEILARSGASSRPFSGKKDEMDFDDDGKSSYDTLREQLLRLCMRDGTPKQARNSVYTISSMLKPLSQMTPGGASGVASRVRKEKKEFEPLLKALVNPSRLSIPDDILCPKPRARILSILSAIAAIAECAPFAFNVPGEGHEPGWGQRALSFCLDTVLLGKNARLNASMTQHEDSSDEDNVDVESTPKKVCSRTTKLRSAKGTRKEVSVHCQMLCGAIEVLVSHIRSSVVLGRLGCDNEAPKLELPPSNHIVEVFAMLVKILEDEGVPPSSTDGRYCNTPQDRAELRRSASVNLLRLCDSNLKLEATYLTPRMWHIMSSVLLDEDKSVRGAFMEELSRMFVAGGKFRATGRAQLAPCLRFVSLVALCADGEGAGNSVANANAANVGQKRSMGAKNAATQCIKSLRTTCQTAAAACRSSGRSAEKNFEARLKMKLMPEYCVPYALHLLAFRHETANGLGTLVKEKDDLTPDVSQEGEEDGVIGQIVHSQEASQRMLKKKLKWLFDPLIQSLGVGADNISFLLRMVELISKHPPINVLRPTLNGVSSQGLDLEENNADYNHACDLEEKQAAARMKIICQSAREVLLSHVKKDVNLTVYPGSIQIPGALYRPRTSMSPPPPVYELDKTEEPAPKKRPKKSISHYIKKKKKHEGEDAMSLDEDDKCGDSSKSEADGKAKVEDEPIARKSCEKSGSIYGYSGQSAGDKSEKMKENPSYEYESPSCSPLCSPTVSPVQCLEKENDSDKDFDHVSPIAKSDSPVGIVQGRNKHPMQAKTSKMVEDPKLEPALGGDRRECSSVKAGKSTVPSQEETLKTLKRKKKRKSNEIEVFDDFASPVIAVGTALPFVSDKGSKKPKSTTCPRTSRNINGKKSKVRPVSVPTSVMVNVTNSATTSSSTVSAVPMTSHRKRAMKKKEKISAVVVATFDEGDGIDFSITPVKLKAKSQFRKNPTSLKQKAPVRTVRAPVKMKASVKKRPTGKNKVKANEMANASARKANVLTRNTNAAMTNEKTSNSQHSKSRLVNASSSTTSEASSVASRVRHGTKRSVRILKS